MKKIIALLIIAALAMAVGCSGGAGKAASVEEIYAAIQEKMVQDLKAAGYQDADFEAEELPGYTVTDLKGEGADNVLADLDKDLVEAGFVIKASMMLNSDQIAVIKAAPGKVGAVQQALEAEQAAQLQLWESYLADQAEKVHNAIISARGGFIILIIYSDAEGIEAIFDEAV